VGIGRSRKQLELLACRRNKPKGQKMNECGLYEVIYKIYYDIHIHVYQEVWMNCQDKL
jgi:hypothetical protein